MKKVTLITTGQPATNPRLVKEVDALTGQGYEVNVIYCFYQAWAVAFDAELMQRSPATFIRCGGSPFQEKLTYYKTRLRQKCCQYLFTYSAKAGIAENAISRTHAEALAIAKAHKSDLYIAHNLGALPAAVLAARHNNAKVGYDAEDMHSGQYTHQQDLHYRLNKYIEEKHFPEVSYFTAAGSLIARAYQKMYAYLKPVTVDNVFPKTSLPFHTGHRSPLRLFWFSQTIGADRGIEDIITALAKLNSPIEFHLLGNCSAEYQLILQKLCAQTGFNEQLLIMHPPVAPDALFAFAAQFDIGMATEISTTLNRDICLTNKIFTYLQCGLAIIASDTQAQRDFITKYPEAGRLYNQHQPASLEDAVQFYLNQPQALLEARRYNYQLGQQTLNWDTESSKFLNVIQQTLAD